MHFSASQSSNNKEKDIRAIYFEEPWEETIDNILYFHHYQLATKYDAWQAAITEKTEAESEKLNIELRRAMLISEKDRLQQTAFKQYTTTEAQWNEEISRIFNRTYSLQTKKNSYNGVACSYQYYKRALETDIFNKNTSYFTWNDDFTELSNAVTNATNEMATAEVEWNAAVQTATLTLAELIKKDTILQSFNQSYIPLIVPENYLTDENFDKTATYYYNADGSYYRINDSLDNYIGKIIYKDINFSKIENDLLNIIQIQLVDSEIPSLIEMYRQKIYDYQTAYEQFLMYNTGNSNGTVKLNNTSSQRLVIGEHFSVDAEGKLKATAGEMDNITVRSLNFQGGWTDRNGNKHTGLMNVVPKWVEFVTDVSATINRSKTSITATVTDEVTVPYIDHVPDVSTTNHTVTVTSWNAPVFISGSDAYLGSSGNTYYGTWATDYVDGKPVYNSQWGTTIYNKIPFYLGVTSVPKNATTQYTATISGSTDVPVVQSISITVKKMGMWTLTNWDSVSSSTKTYGQTNNYFG